MKLKAKIVVLFSLVILLGTLAMGTFATYTLNVQIKDTARDKVKSDAALGLSLIDELYPGDWSVQGDQLYKGDTVMNNNSEIVDLIAKETGDSATIFRGDTRVATNVKKPDGSRAIGTKAIPEVVQTTLNQGQNYLGEATVVGTIHQATYQPLKDQSGKIIGMWSVLVPNTSFDAMVAKFRNQVIIFGVVGLLVAIIAAYIVAEYNSRPLKKLAEVAQQVAEGDLRVEKLPTKRKDEFGQLAVAVNGMVDNLHDLISSVNQTAAMVASSSEELTATTEQATMASEQITATIQSVASGAEFQLQGATESATAIDEMAIGIQKIAETSVNVAEVSLQSAQEAEQGNESIQHAVYQMGNIYQTVNESAASVQLLEQRSLEIGKIVEVITSIAAQTNVLALNAAIEAARAGENGRGFAVVADEVRKLAEQSGESAGQIAHLIEAIQQETSRAVGAMDEVIFEVKSGTEVVNVAGAAFQRILESAKQVADQIQDVTASSQEMTASSQQVAHAVDEVTRIARDSAVNAQTVAASSEEQLASMEEITSSSTALSQLAHELQEMIGKFQV
ncbi:MAG: methyl-accepting chemotaxis protein [Tumebacillaceae bacterium]